MILLLLLLLILLLVTTATKTKGIIIIMMIIIIIKITSGIKKNAQLYPNIARYLVLLKYKLILFMTIS